MKLFLIKLLFLFGTLTLFSQNSGPRMMVKNNNNERMSGIAINRVDATIRIHGFLAETTLTMTFHNSSNRELEGELYFPLPEGATVSGYALDIKGVLVDGVVVEKQRARQVFEAITRERIDPGLMEKVQGNVFKTRVYPLPPRGKRIVRVKFVSELSGNRESLYRLPLDYPDKLNEFNLSVLVAGTEKPEARQGFPDGFDFELRENAYFGQISSKNASITEDLVIATPKSEPQTALLEKGKNGVIYFALHDLPPVPDFVKTPPPEKITILWDASGSRLNAKHELEFSVLKSYFSTLNERNVKVNLIVFRNDVEKPMDFEIVKGNCEELIKTLRNLAYDGGTNLHLPKIASEEQPDFYFLFSDGLANFQNERLLNLDRPIYVFSSSKTVDHAWAKALTRSHGGRYFNLLLRFLPKVVQEIGQTPFSFIEAKYDSGKILDFLPSSPKILNKVFVASGKLLSDEAVINLNYGIGQKIMLTRKFRLSAKSAFTSDLTRRFWAERKLEELLVSSKKNKSEIISLAKHHGLVTQYTSLLVLESLEQYIQYQIEPPESLPKWKESYQKAALRFSSPTKIDNSAQLAQTIQNWTELVMWWNTLFIFSPNFKYQLLHSNAFISMQQGRRNVNFIQTPWIMRSYDVPHDDGNSDSWREDNVYGEDMDLDNEKESWGDDDNWGDDDDDDDDDGESSGRSGPAAKIAIQAWEPEASYLWKLRNAMWTKRGFDELYRLYLSFRPKYRKSPAFYFNSAELFFDNEKDHLGTRILSNLAELGLDNPSLLRSMGRLLARYGQLDQAVKCYEKVLSLRPEEPQSYRHLALVLADRAKKEPKTRQSDYRRALELLYKIVLDFHDSRFSGIINIALVELNHLIPIAKKAGVEYSAINPKLIKDLTMDLRVLVSWDSDMTDIDLKIIEPSGEEVTYRHSLSTIGGHLSKDATQGYGPEEYFVRQAMPGTYQVKCKYYADSSVKLLGPVKVHVTIFTNYGRANEERRSVSVDLAKEKEEVEIAKAQIEVVK